MSLMRQLMLLLALTLLLAVGAAGVVSMQTLRESLESQLTLKNHDNARTLAVALSSQQGDVGLMTAMIKAQFDTGYYERLRWVGADGRVVVQQQSDASTQSALADGVPAWFMDAWPVRNPPGVAALTSGWQLMGHIEVRSQARHVYAAMWHSVWVLAVSCALIALFTVGLAVLGLRRVRQPLDALVAQAQAVSEGSYHEVPESRTPELQRLSRAMNGMVAKVKALFEAQSEQLRLLQAQAQADTVTGLLRRKHFMAELGSALARDEGPVQAGMILLRLRDLAGLNRRLGHGPVDQVLSTLGRTLAVYPERVPGCLAGRLNGADFALWLPAPDMARDTASVLMDLLRSALPHQSQGVQVAIAAVDLPRAAPLSQWFGEADAVLTRAEQGQGLTLASMTAATVSRPVQGEQVWRQQLMDALQSQRLRLVNYPVVDPLLRVLHWECPLQVQLQPDGEHLPAAHWLPLAQRSQLTTDVDLRAVQSALQLAAQDSDVRSVNIAVSTLQDGHFLPRLRELLFQNPQHARRLCLELGEGAAHLHFELLHEMTRQLRPLGVAVGLEHAGAGLARIDRLYQAGLDFVKLDAAVVKGVASDASRAAFARGLAIMLHSLAIKVYAEGVDDALDAQALWECGVDGITGPWATHALAHPAPPA